MTPRVWSRIALGLLGNMAGVPVLAQSVSLPLQYVGNPSNNPASYRLGINVGINGGPGQLYLFDTGSALFNAAYNPATWNGYASGLVVNNAPASPSLVRQYNYSYLASGYYGNVVQVPLLSFYSAGAATPAVALSASPGYLIGAVYRRYDGSITQDYPSWFSSNTGAPVEGNFYGTFGAAAFATMEVSTVAGGGRTVVGGVLGQTIVPGLAAQGYVVAANGQTNPTNAALGLANAPASGTATVTLGGQAQSVTACNPCVTVGLTPQIMGQFLPVGPPGANPSRAGAMPLAQGTYNFPNPYGGATGNSGTNEFGAMARTSLNGQSATTPVLFDTGTAFIGLPGLTGTGTLTVIGTNQQGQVVAGLPVSSSIVTSGASPTTYNTDSSYTNAVLGIAFFMQNSVMFDLSDGLLSYTPYFVTADPLATTAAGGLVIGAGTVPLGLAGIISGPGGLAVQGGGSVQLSATNSYTGATTVAPSGTLLISGPGSIAQSSGVTNNGTFDISRAWAPVAIQSLTGAGQVNLGGQNLTLTNASGTFSGTMADGGSYGATGGSLTVAGGALTFAGTGTYTGGTLVASAAALTLSGTLQGAVFNAGSFANNGTVFGAVSNIGLLSGNGTIAGNLANAGVVAPGNSIGTLSVGGNFINNGGGVLMAEVNGAGQSDLLAIAGTATLQGGSVYVYAQPGTNLAPHTTWRILSAAGGLTGSFASVNELYPFLQSSLTYDANNTYLTLDIGGFAAAAATPTQATVGRVLDANVNTATGDFAQVLSAMATGVLSNTAAQAVLQQLSGNNYAGFSSSMVQGAQLFMNNFASQGGGGATIGSASANNRVALAEACDVACDTVSPPRWGAWGGALGGLGTIGAGQAVGAVTYNAGGFAAGLDRSIADGFRVGVLTGYTTGTQWVGGFNGVGRTDTVQAGLYGGYAQGPLYADALAGYAYSANQMWRQITIPGLQPRTARGLTGANQLYGQLESGYRVELGTAANAFVTPFARLQGYTGTQNAFTENGAQSLDLSVAQQTTRSLRSVLGAQVGGSMDLGWREKLALQVRLGWSHEYADVARPVTATLAGAPAMPFTTFGLSSQRDGVVLGLAANTAIAQATSIYLRYEGNVSGQDNAHALTAGLRMTW